MKFVHHFEFICKSVVILSVVIEGSIHGVLVNEKACRGGPAHFNATGGTITSPLHPRGSPTQVLCSWILHNPRKDTLILSFSAFDLAEDTNCGKRSYDCCPHQWLMIKSEALLPERSKREVSHSEEKKKKKDFSSRRKNGREDHEDQELEDNSMSLKRKWLTLFRHPLLNGTFSDFLNSKTSHRHDLSAPKVKITGSSEIKNLKRRKTTGRVCGKTSPIPFITTDPVVIVKFYSDRAVEPGHLGFTLQFQISNNLTVCNAEEFMCNEPQLCIPKSWQCNGQAECPDSTDEADCQAGCPGLADDEHCDGRWHCTNGEDELGCFGCEADEWWCGEGTDCYKAKRRCDGIPDCRNGADEVYCNCFNQTHCGPNSEFCYDAKTQRCDGILHCPNGHDEMDCGGHCRHMIQCGHGGVCYTSAQRCDGVSQCDDGSDEASCTPQLCHPQHGAFLCANHRCIKDSWLCDQFDDCGDESDEIDCLRNSVIVAAAMGGLVCSLLLVIAVGCTCRLYALRVGITRYRQQGYRGGRRSTPLAPLSRLEQHLLQREPPPSYSVAVNDPSAALFGSRRLNRQWRRQRRRPPAPPEGVLPPLPVPMRGHVAPGPPHAYDTGPGHTSNLRSVSGGSSGRRSGRGSDEKEGEEEPKAVTPNPVPHASSQHSLPGSTVDDDVALLSAVANDAEVGEDTPLLEVTSTSEDSADESLIDDDDALLLDVAPDSETSDSDFEGRDDDSRASVNCGDSEGAPSAENVSPAMEANAEDLAEDACRVDLHESSALDSDSVVEDNLRLVSSPTDENFVTVTGVFDGTPGSPDTASLLGDFMTDTRAAVLALSVVQRHTDDVNQADTELTSQ